MESIAGAKTRSPDGRTVGRAYLPPELLFRKAVDESPHEHNLHL